jgi:hypothetical protein
VAVGLTLDAGALSAAEKGSRAFWALWKSALAVGATVTIPAAVLAQVFRGNSAALNRIVKAAEVEALDEAGARRIGARLGQRKGRDVVDAAVVIGAAARGDAIVTSDRGDLQRLIARGERVVIVDI